MARTIKQIKKGMTDQFMSESVIREKYGLAEGDTFEGSFSSVSIESILFGIFAATAYVLEVLFDNFKLTVDKKIASAVPATIAWYYKVCLEYQHGDKLVLDPKTQQYTYEVVDPSKQVIKYAACRDKTADDDRGAYIYILVSGEDEQGFPCALQGNVLTPFEAYLKAKKPAGILLEIHTYNPDDIELSMKIQYDPLLISPDGSLISDSSRFPVEEAINSYLKNIEYGGVFNKTRLIDAIQKAEGVVDLELASIKAKPYVGDEYKLVTSNNYESAGGALKAHNLRNTIEYVQEF